MQQVQTVIDWANENAGLLNLVFAAVVAFSAILTAAFTSKLAWETVKLRKAETDPDVAVYLDAVEGAIGVFHLVIRNIGRGPAHRVSFDVEPKEHPSHEMYMGNLAVLRDGIKYLSPNQDLRSFVGTYEQLQSAPVAITATYHGKPGGRRSPFVETFTLDVRQFDGVRPPHPLLEKQTNALERIAKELAGLRSDRTVVRGSVDALPPPSEVSAPSGPDPRRWSGNRGALARLWAAVRQR